MTSYRKVQDIPCPDWLVSDTHFGHRRIIELCSRPFSTIEEHDQYLIDRWNERVAHQDWVLHLGDFALGTHQYCQYIRSRLNGRICLVLGNHDRSVKKMQEAGFDQVVKYGRFEYRPVRTVLCTHRPDDLSKLQALQTDRWVLHGHTHRPATRLGHTDCGVDNLEDYAPVRLTDVVLDQ
jgi:calcineurin-like phosphoesterase family protein